MFGNETLFIIIVTGLVMKIIVDFQNRMGVKSHVTYIFIRISNKWQYIGDNFHYNWVRNEYIFKWEWQDDIWYHYKWLLKEFFFFFKCKWQRLAQLAVIETRHSCHTGNYWNEYNHIFIENSYVLKTLKLFLNGNGKCMISSNIWFYKKQKLNLINKFQKTRNSKSCDPWVSLCDCPKVDYITYYEILGTHAEAAAIINMFCLHLMFCDCCNMQAHSDYGTSTTEGSRVLSACRL